jgi:hypothetical protein
LVDRFALQESGIGHERTYAQVGLQLLCLVRSGTAGTTISWVSEVIVTGRAESTFVIATSIEDAKDCDCTVCIVNLECDDGAPPVVRDA